MRALLLALVLVLSCSTEPDVAVGTRIVRDCGAAPQAPDWTATIDGNVSMSQGDYSAIVTFRDAVTAWESCVVEYQ